VEGDLMTVTDSSSAQQGEYPCFWIAEALRDDPDEEPPLNERIKADVCIVGGGYAGLWTAIHLKERSPDLDVVVIERRLCGTGASGRNEGMLMSWWSKFPTLVKYVGPELALELCHHTEAVVSSMGEFLDREGIDVQYRHSGWLWTATNRSQLEAWRPTMDKLAEFDQHPFAELTGAEVAERAGSKRFLGGVHETSVATVQPAKLARALRTIALRRGVRIFERTEMTELDRGSPSVVHTPSGAVTSPVVVIAMNAWGARVRELRRRLVVISTDAFATKPLGERLPPAIADGEGVTDSRRLIIGCRATKDGRIAASRSGGALVFGGRLGDRYEGPSPRVPEMLEYFRWTFPELGDADAVTSWRGPIDYSVSGLPYIGPLGAVPGLFVAAGFSGNGVGPCYLAGQSLAAQILGGEDVLKGSALTKPQPGALPPEPFRYLGGRIVRSAIDRKERREDEDRKVDPITTALASLDPTSFMDRTKVSPKR
jgi:glycine/D-amino acid oxidase-like deaminating enzyme